MGNPRPVFSGTLRAAAAFRPLGQTGVRGRVRRSGGGADLDCLSWSPGCLSGAGRGDEFESHFRLRRGRAGAPEAEIVAARASARTAAPEPAPLLPDPAEDSVGAA